MLNKAKCSLLLIKREFLNEYINILIFLANRKNFVRPSKFKSRKFNIFQGLFRFTRIIL